MLHAVFVQMAGNSVVDVPRCEKLVRAVRLMAFVTTASEERAGFVLLKARATNDGEYLLGEETSDGGAWGKVTILLLPSERRPRHFNSQCT